MKLGLMENGDFALYFCGHEGVIQLDRTEVVDGLQQSHPSDL